MALNADFVPPHHTGAAMYVRPLLYGSSAQLGLNPPEEYTFLVYVLPTGVYHGTKPVKALILEEFDRAAPEGTGSAKVGGNYAPVLRWSEKAYKAGYGITLHLDSKTRTEIEEFSTSGFIGVKKEGESVTLVIPDSKRVIRSITSDSVQEIAKSLGWKVEVRPVRFTLFYATDELELTSNRYSTQSYLAFQKFSQPAPRRLSFPLHPSHWSQSRRLSHT